MKRLYFKAGAVICAIICLLSVAIRSQAAEDWRTWSQHDSRWNTLYMGGNPEATVSAYGCAVTAVTKCIIQGGFKSSDNFHVGTLTNWLNSNGGFESNGCIRWSVPCGVTSGFNFVSYVPGVYYSSSELCPQILTWVNEGYHIVLGVGGHYIAVDNYKTAATGQVYIMDSGLVENNADVLLTNQYGTIYEYVLYSGYAEGTSVPEQSVLEYKVVNNEVCITGCDSSFQGHLTIPSTIEGYPVTSIGNYAFSYCSSLTSITIPDGVTTIGSHAFYGCSSMTNVTIPDSVTNILECAFAWCYNLKSVSIGNGVTNIGKSVFYRCSHLTNIVIPDNVTSIGENAFGWCDNLASVTIGGGITCISNQAFECCVSLTNITIPDNVTSIGDAAFNYCTSLTNINIPYSIDTIGEFVFSDCRSLCGIWVDEKNPYYSSDHYGVLFDKNKTVLLAAPGTIETYVIPDSVTSIGNYAFNACFSLTSVSIPDSVTCIGEGAFGWCERLNTVYYAGTEEQWQDVFIDNTDRHYGYYFLTNANIIFNYKPDFGKVDTWNLILKEDIGVNFEMEFTDTILADPNAYVEINVAGKITKIPVSTAVNGLQIDVAPAQMTDEIKICIVSSNGTRDEVSTYSVRGYADAILSGGYSNQTKNMVRYMLTYGAMAQKYFGYNESTLANEGINCTLEDVPDLEEAVVGISGELEGVTFYGASLVYRDCITLRYYFTGDITGLTFAANGSTYRPVAKDGMHYVEIANILPQDLDNQITLTVIDPQGGTISVTYGPMNYIVRMNAAGSSDLKNLLKALYNYHLAAKAMV